MIGIQYVNTIMGGREVSRPYHAWCGAPETLETLETPETPETPEALEALETLEVVGLNGEPPSGCVAHTEGGVEGKITKSL